jgi:hypothetical protein
VSTEHADPSLDLYGSDGTTYRHPCQATPSFSPVSLLRITTCFLPIIHSGRNSIHPSSIPFSTGIPFSLHSQICDSPDLLSSSILARQRGRRSGSTRQSPVALRLDRGGFLNLIDVSQDEPCDRLRPIAKLARKHTYTLACGVSVYWWTSKYKQTQRL